MTPKSALVLVASDAASDAESAREVLSAEFERVITSSDSSRAVADFDAAGPDVLVLAFQDVERAEQFYLGLYRHSASIAHKPHWSVLLCTKRDARAAHALCRRSCFDDYVVFWPATFDPLRLAMSAQTGLRFLALASASAPGAQKVAALSRGLAEVEPVLDAAVAEGRRRLERTGATLRHVMDGLDTAVRDLSRGVEESAGAQALGGPLREVSQRLQRFSDEHLLPGMLAVEQSLEPVRDSLADAGAVVGPRVRALRTLASQLSPAPTILVIEDEETQRQILKHLLQGEGYSLAFAANGSEALRAVARQRPDLILMDLALPDFDGRDLTRQFKRSGALAQVPVVMITGHSERDVVVEALEAGAADFLVKPFTPKSLSEKIEQHLRGASH
jgi:CheY-like chemotaxis protein